MQFITKRIAKKIGSRIEGYEFEVGILKDGPHYSALRGERGAGGLDVLSQFAGGPVRKKSRVQGTTLGELSKQIRSEQVDFLKEPFKESNQDDAGRFLKVFMDYVFGRSTEQRLINLAQAIVRNPILRGDYGSNSELTQEIKKFDRYLIDTGQFFKAIRARITKKPKKRRGE